MERFSQRPATEAEANALEDTHVGDVVAGEADFSRIRAERPGEHIEEGGLAGAVGADKAVQAVGMDIKREVRGSYE
jgi:hypothetical protein